MLMSELDRYLSDINGPTYKSKEIRNGPPLGYIAEKMKNGLIEQHRLLRELRMQLPDDMSANAEHYDLEDMSITSMSVKNDLLMGPAYNAFYFQTLAYLALMQMLDLANTNDVKRYSEMTGSDFEKWIEFVDRQASEFGIG